MPDIGAVENAKGPVALRRARFVVAYHGAGFHGFAPNPNVATVVGVLTDAIGRVARHGVELVGAGRTDAGVHAWGQVISCDLPADTDLADLVRHVNRMCAPRVVLRDADWAAAQFSARFDATWRHYRYTVFNSAVPHPFLGLTSWHVPRPLSLPTMQLACDPLIGEHDFATFCRKPEVSAGQDERSLRRRVVQARWTDVSHQNDMLPGDGRLLRFDIRANAFCHQMVRSIVGTLVDVGRGHMHAGEVRALMLSRDRQLAPALAPAHGLTLWEVGYSGPRLH